MRTTEIDQETVAALTGSYRQETLANLKEVLKSTGESVAVCVFGLEIELAQEALRSMDSLPPESKVKILAALLEAVNEVKGVYRECAAE